MRLVWKEGEEEGWGMTRSVASVMTCESSGGVEWEGEGEQREERGMTRGHHMTAGEMDDGEKDKREIAAQSFDGAGGRKLG